MVNRGSWLVYFNGIEVPAIAVTVSGGVSQIPQATVSFPPDRTMRRIGAEDRVRMTVFFLDEHRGNVDGKGRKWRLLFDGDVVSFQYVNTPEGRQLSYTAVDPMEALGRVFPFFTTSLLSLAEGTVSTQNNAVTAAVNPFAITNSLFSVGLDKEGSRVNRPFDIVFNVLKLLTTTDPPIGDQRSIIATGWFAEWNRRNRFTDRFVPSAFIEGTPEDTTAENDDPVFPLLKAAQAESAIDALIRLGNDVANRSSMYALVQSLFQHVYYELQMNLAPPFLGVNSENRKVVGPAVTRAQDQDLQQILEGDVQQSVAAAGIVGNSIGQYMTKPQTLFAVPPAFNVMWPSMIKQHSYSENYAKQPTRTYVGNPHLFNVLTGAPGKEANGALKQVAARAMTSGYPYDPVDNKLEDKLPPGGRADVNHHNFLVYPEEFFKGPVYYNHNMPPIFTYLAQQDEDKKRLKRLTRLYAKYEHFRTRFANRNGGVSMDFNPYILHGFPGVVIDNSESNMHTFCYITSVTHSLTSNSMDTSVSYTYAQTLDEFFENMAEDQVEFGVQGADSFQGPVPDFQRSEIPMSPTNPLESVGKVFQKFLPAESYYDTMFWGGQSLGLKDPTAFNWFDVFGVVNEETGAVEDISVASILQQSDSNAVADEATGIVPQFVVKPQFLRQVLDSQEAFNFVSRPVCTLDEWIDFHPAGVRNGERAATDPKEGKGHKYWLEILELIQGPGVEPSKDTEGVHCDASEVDTRRNWRARLLEFRKRVYLDPHHHSA
jgi:hypothetical protein